MTRRHSAPTDVAVLATWAGSLAAAWSCFIVSGWITSPGRYTDLEFVTTVAVVVPLLGPVVLARWAANGHPLLPASQNVTVESDPAPAGRHDA